METKINNTNAENTVFDNSFDTQYINTENDATEFAPEAADEVRTEVVAEEPKGMPWKKVVVGGVVGIAVGGGAIAAAMNVNSGDHGDVDSRLANMGKGLADAQKSVASDVAPEDAANADTDANAATEVKAVEENVADAPAAKETHHSVHHSVAPEAHNVSVDTPEQAVAEEVVVTQDTHNDVAEGVTLNLNVHGDEAVNVTITPGVDGEINVNVNPAVDNVELIDEPIAEIDNGHENLSPELQPLVSDNVPVAGDVSDNMSFGEAFAAARAEVGPGGVFEWHGTLYGTYTAEEWDAMSDSQKVAFNDNFAWSNNYHPSHIDDLAHVDTADGVILDDSSVIENVETYIDPASGTAMAVADVDGVQTVMMDLDGDGILDMAVADLNGDGSMQANEMQYIGDFGLEITDDASDLADLDADFAADSFDV